MGKKIPGSVKSNVLPPFTKRLVPCSQIKSAPVVKKEEPEPEESSSPIPVETSEAPVDLITEDLEIIEEEEESFPEWKPSWKKKDLLAVADEVGLSLSEDNTKKQIIKALKKAEKNF